MSTWKFQTRRLLLPKSGHQISECEDAIGINAASRRFAVADGATEAFDSQTWARLLAHGWVELEPSEQTREEFRAWVAKQGQCLHDSWNGLRLSWYAEEKARTGSFAAFVGVQLELEAAFPSWKAIALGDSCLLHCRNEEILDALPVLHYQSFNATPLLVPSQLAMQDQALENVVVASGTLKNGDVLLLLSDAIAAWYLMLVDKEDQTRSFFDLLLKTGRADELQQLLEKDRLSGRLKDDDIAVIRIEVEQIVT